MKTHKNENARKERLDPKYHQYFYGPYSGMLGQTVIAALYLDDHWDRFIAWLGDRNIDPGPCGRWINEKLELLAVMKAVKRTNTGVADFSGYGEASDIDWSWFNKNRVKKELDATNLARFRVFIKDVLSAERKLPHETKHLETGVDRHSEYSMEACELLTALFLIDSRNDFKAWLYT